MPDNTLSTLNQIRVKVRRLTKSPSASQISDATIDEYVNNFVLYDFPSNLKTFTLRTILTFYTEPYVDTYAGDDIVTNFNNIYTAIYENIYIAGRRATFIQDRDQFFSLYPKTESKVQIGLGDGATTAFAGTLTGIPMLPSYVTFSSIDAANNGITAYDDGANNLDGDVTVGAINYITGVYAFTFSTPPGANEPVYAQTVAYSPGIPTIVLYHNNQFVFRQVPDQPYRVEVEVAQRPTELINNNAMPEISQWWQYIAYGAAKKVFEDRMDIESIEKIMPEFRKQEILVNRRTIDQISKERVATIYSGVTNTNYFDNGKGA